MASLTTAKLIQRLISFFVLTFFALDLTPALAQNVENVQMEAKVGQTLILKLPGLPDSGYKWRMITAESQGQDLVDIRELGWTYHLSRGYFTVRKVGILRYTVETRAPGKALLVFEYRRMVPEPPPGRRHIVEIDIRPTGRSN